ncbi:hypothetical protein [Rhizobium sp. L9]|uniref:hypothetical protein n=1 Tax=Rhizobium sp. L9 TaxID=1340738 RepID=UPI0011433953|nr:hypothetical protein [Rhizobium sp. L9]
MIKRRKHHLGPDVSPQAIIWRPIRYFTNEVSEDDDDLDHFKFASYALNNDVFDLRVYLQHPEMTVTLYLPSDIDAEAVIQSKVAEAIKVLAVPKAAVAWQRGEEFSFGGLSRRPDDRLRESEARILVLKIAASFEGHTAPTSAIKKKVPDFYQLSSRDLEWSATRKNEQMWQQIVGNVKVHHAGASSIFSRGWAERTADGIRVTAAGILYLKSIGFSSD